MNRQLNALSLKANRMLGANLVQIGLLPPENLEAANEEYIRQRHGEDPLASSLLKILLFDLQSLSEDKLLAYQIEHHGLGVLPISRYQVQESILPAEGVSLCRATWTVPIDRVEGIHFLASSYFLSPFVRQYWCELLPGEIVWYGVPFQEMTLWLEQARNNEKQAAAAATKVPASPSSS